MTPSPPSMSTATEQAATYRDGELFWRGCWRSADHFIRLRAEFAAFTQAQFPGAPIFVAEIDAALASYFRDHPEEKAAA